MDGSGEANEQNILVIIGPSGSGKSAVVKELIRQKIVKINPTWTTRPQRQNEEEVEHVFVNEKKFDNLVASGFFLEHTKPFNLPFSYGLPPVNPVKSSVPVVMLRSFLIPLMLKHYPKIIIYQIEAPFEHAKERVVQRSEDEGTRLALFNQEVAEGRLLAARIFKNQNAGISELVSEVSAAIKIDFKST